jgi:hypothetical protein
MKVAQRKPVSFFNVLSDSAVHAPPVETAAKSGLYNLSIFIDHVNQTSSGRFSTSRYAITPSAECIRPDLWQDANASATVTSSGAGAGATASAAPVADTSGQILHSYFRICVPHTPDLSTSFLNRPGFHPDPKRRRRHCRMYILFFLPLYRCPPLD